MKRYILNTLAIAGCIAITTISYAQTWTQIGYMIVGTDTLRGSQTRAISGFGQDVYACSELGLFKSTNNGNNWSNLTAGKAVVQNEKLVSVLVANNGNLFLGSDNKLFKSTDGGNSWSAFTTLPDSTKFWDLAEINGNIVASYTKGSGGGVYYSNDYGTTWNTATGISSQVRYFLSDNSTLYLGGTANGVYKSTDKGQTWTAGGGFPANAGIWNLEKKGNKLFASSVGGKGLFSSTNDGATWDSAATGYFATAFCQIYGMKANNSVIVVAHNGAAAIGCGVAFRISTDSGNTWTAFETGLNTSSRYYPTLGKNADGSLMFTIRNNGTEVYRYGTASTSIGNSLNPSSPISVYPNPANETVTLDQIPAGSTLKILDISGKTVYGSVIHNQQTHVNTSGFTNGVYFIQVEFNGAFAYSKLVINK